MKVNSLLIIFFSIALLACSKAPESNESISVDFEQFDKGKLTDAQTKKMWPGARIRCGKKDFIFYKLGITPHPFFIEEEDGNSFLKVLLPKNHYGPITGAQWRIPLAPKDEYFFSYKVRFDDDFDFVRGGKLPGLAGGVINAGHIPNGNDGWLARMMYWEKGKLSFYVYFPNQSTIWGERLYLKNAQQDTLEISKGQWHRITQRVKLNTPGKNDGVLQAWFDEQEAFYTDTILFRESSKLQADYLSYNVFMGGGDSSWAPSKNQYIYFDDFRISSQAITP